MGGIPTKTLPGLQFTQVAWVVKDVTATRKFFIEVMGVKSFSKPEIIRAKDFDATYNGKPTDSECFVSMAYNGGTFIELIQPVSGSGMFHEYLEKNPAGGIHHIAYSILVADLDKVIAELKDKGYPVISTYDTPIAKIVFVDSYKELGVITEIMGINKEGEKAVEKMKGGERP